MKYSSEEIKIFIEGLSLPSNEKSLLLEYYHHSNKELLRMDFKMQRILKDKSIIINLLNTTIEDLSSHQKMIEKTNQELSRQKAEIEAKNKELESQKQLVEEQSRKLAENLRDLEMSYSELEQFSYIASHDLKSPLRTIASYAGLLKRRYNNQLDEDASQFIDFIVKGASHMDNIIRDLLEYSCSGKENDFAHLNLNDTLDMVKFNLQIEIQENSARLEYDPLPKLFVHKSGMLQLFQNLIGNSIKYRGYEPPHISIGHQLENETWYFKISDNGLGMDETLHEKAFQPFQRISHLDRPGTGMGLAICKKIVKMHQGDIWFKSQPGQGTTFHFTIPQNPERPLFQNCFHQRAGKNKFDN